MLSNIIKNVGILFFVFFVFQLLFLDKYPEIDKNNKSVSVINNEISVRIEENAKRLSFEYVDDKSELIDAQDEFKNFVAEFDKCKDDVDCKIEAYDDYMDDNVATVTRKRYKAAQIYEFYGNTLGQLINETFGVFY